MHEKATKHLNVVHTNQQPWLSVCLSVYYIE